MSNQNTNNIEIVKIVEINKTICLAIKGGVICLSIYLIMHGFENIAKVASPEKIFSLATLAEKINIGTITSCIVSLLCGAGYIRERNLRQRAEKRSRERREEAGTSTESPTEILEYDDAPEGG